MIFCVLVSTVCAINILELDYADIMRPVFPFQGFVACLTIVYANNFVVNLAGLHILSPVSSKELICASSQLGVACLNYNVLLFVCVRIL
jgi:hypothetical protein